MIHPVIHLIDILVQMLRIEVAAGLVCSRRCADNKWSNFCIEHADDLTAVIAGDRLSLLIPERRKGEATEVVRVHLAVDVSKLSVVVQQILGRGAVTGVEDLTVL